MSLNVRIIRKGPMWLKYRDQEHGKRWGHIDIQGSHHVKHVGYKEFGFYCEYHVCYIHD
jgi:hypothetical protein